MRFIDAIQKYQQSGDSVVFTIIRDAMSIDYMHSPTGMKFEKPEMYVAFRCLRLLRGFLATIKYTLTDYGLHSRRDAPEHIFSEFSVAIEGWTGIKLTVENFTEHEEYLSKYLPTFNDLRRAYERIIGVRPTLWQLFTEEIIEENWIELQKALEYAVRLVDTSRSEREIVRFINSATRTAYYRNQFEGMRRVRRGGKTKYVTPNYYGPIYTVLGRANFDLKLLTRRQSKLVDRITEIVRDDHTKGETDNYNVDLRGGYIIKNRYIAERIGMHEASLSRALSKIKSVK